MNKEKSVTEKGGGMPSRLTYAGEFPTWHLYFPW